METNLEKTQDAVFSVKALQNTLLLVCEMLEHLKLYPLCADVICQCVKVNVCARIKLLSVALPLARQPLGRSRTKGLISL